MSIVRIGMAEDKKFGDGYAAIFGKKAEGDEKKPAAKTPAKATAKKKPAKKK